ncbi:hypothetical protein TrVE_jg10321 [Triparma verrucosa]|uniref:Elongin-C n=2 Tax=Triparma TaxID=722752 RepID=A0A9W7EHD2_9STRA|nr:hypothetical protein TrST_g11398 [Triparma strigata]GMH95091.1 hypothetical protein TrVE_jg10321 [Triparma verrucosa]
MASETPSGADFVKLVSAEGHEFFVTRKVAMVSGTIRAMLESSMKEANEGVIPFPEISTAVLEKTIQYCHYKLRYTNSTSKIPEFKIEPDMALELLMSSNYLDL